MKGLGTLEARVMDLLWASEESLSVRDMVNMLPGDYAYTTILTVVTHLYEKDWVSRDKLGRAYLYRPAQSRAEATSQVLRDIIDTSGDPEGVMLHLARTVTASESAAFRRGLARARKKK